MPGNRIYNSNRSRELCRLDIPKPFRSPDVRMTGCTPSFCGEILVIMQSCDCNYVEQPCILVDQHFDLKQPGKVDGGANRSDTAHRGVAGGEDRTQKRSIKVIRYTKL